MGIWRLNNEKWYRIFSVIYQLYLAIFELTLIVGGIDKIIQTKDLAVFNNVMIFQVFYSLLIWRTVLCQHSKTLKLVEEIISTEKLIRSENDRILDRIFKKISLYAHRMIILISSSMLIVCVTFFIMFVKDVITVFKNNGNTDFIMLPYFQWLPFYYEDKWIILIYFFQMVNGILVAFLSIASEAFIFSLIYFPVLRLRILGHKFINFQHFTNATKHDPVQYLRTLILEHKNIIR